MSCRFLTATSLCALFLGLTFKWVYSPTISAKTTTSSITLKQLQSIQLQHLDGSRLFFPAYEVWKDTGAVLMIVRRPG